MHTKIKYFVWFFVLISASALAQKDLVVYHITGDVNITTGNRSAVAKRGNILTKNNSLQLKQGSDCMLIEEKGKSLQVNTAGIYNYNALQKMIANAGTAGVTQKFFSYVYNNMFSGKQSDKLSITPVVFRGNELMKTPFDNTIIISDAFAFVWKNPTGKIWAHLIIKDSADKIIVDTVIKHSTSLQINIAENNLLAGNIYKWKVEETGTRQHSEKYFHFLITGKNERRQILKDLKLLQDNKMSNNLKMEMQQDIFLKWKQYYLQKA